MKHNLTALLFLFTCLIISANEESGFITGKVFDSHTNMPLPSATVLYGRGMGVSTESNGFFAIETEPGNVNLIIRFVGYKSVTRSVYLEPDDTIVLEIGMEYEVAEIDQIVVSAGRIEQRVSELTVTVNIIKPAILETSHISNAAELVKLSPGIEVLDGQASIRGGSGFSYGAGSRVLALIDGLPVLSADAGNIKWQYLPMENISQIEIIKGASSVLYGSSALNGVINFRTANAGNNPATKFYFETGMFGRPAQKRWIWWDSPRTWSSASFSHLRKSGNMDIGISAHLLYDDGYRKFNDEKLGRLNLKLKRYDKKINGLTYGLNINGGLTRKTDFVLWEDATLGALIQNESTINELHGNLFTFDPYVSLNRNNNSTHDLRVRVQTSENRHPEAVHNNSNALSFLAEYQLRYNLLNKIDLDFGLLENYSNITSPFYGNHYSLNLAGFLQTSISVDERLKLVAGVRAEHNSLDGVEDQIVPLFRAGINYRLLNYTFLRASFGQGYRYPSIAEKHAATTLGSVRIVPNPDVRSESGWTSEIGIKQGILSGNIHGQIDLAFFYSRYSDMIEFLFGIYPTAGEDGFSYGFMASNVEQSKVYGGELEFGLSGYTGRIYNSLGGGYTFIYPVESGSGGNENVFLKYRRKHSIKLNLTSTFKRFSFGLNLNAGSALLNIDNVFINEITREAILPGFYDYWMRTGKKAHIIIDPHLIYDIGSQYKVSIVVKNILNTEYMGRPGDVMPHRSFSIRFSGSF